MNVKWFPPDISELPTLKNAVIDKLDQNMESCLRTNTVFN